jgi:lipoprotein-releasing system permease protein
MASILGIALGVTVLITTLAVMSGFQKEIRDRLLQMSAHTTISRDGEPMSDWQRAVDVAYQDPRVAGAAPYIEIQAMISGPRVQGALVQGVDPAMEPKVSVVAEKMKKGRFDDLTQGSYNIILGQELATWLGVDVGDQVVATLAEVQGTPMGAIPRMKRFTVSGIFEAGYNEIDRGVAFANMKDLERVLRIDGATGVRLKLHDMDQALTVGVDLAQRLGGAYRVSDWTQQNANLYHSLRMEKVVMGILLSLIIAMGAFNLVSSQVMLVTDKQADIAILRTLGLTPRGVMGVFMVQGSLIGIIGTVAGVIGGITLTLNLERILGAIEAVFNVKLLPEDVYYITGLPTDMQTADIVVITVVALLMSFLATLYPAWRAARTQPAEALRYE